MKRSQLKSALNLQEKLEALDRDIAHLNKIAHVLAAGNSRVDFTVNIQDLAVPQRKQTDTHSSGSFVELIGDIDGFWKVKPLDKRTNCDCEACRKERDSNHELKGLLIDSECLEFLVIILRRKNRQRDKVLNKLKKLGVE